MSKIGIGIVGAGWMGGTLLTRLAEREDVQVLALLESNASRGKAVLAERGLPENILVDNYSAIIENPDIDAVFVVSPNCFHAKQSLAAMNAGKHVFSEKPLSTTFDDYCALIEAERAHPELITYVDYILNFDSMEDHLKKMVAESEFGTITQIQVNYRHPINISGDKSWKLDKSIMGDAIGMGINHSLSVMVNVMSPQARPCAVYATSMPAKVRGFEVDPVWNILIKFDNGSTGFCFGNIDFSNGYDAYHNLFGTEGGFVFDSQLERTHKVRYWSEKTTGGNWVYPLDAAKCAADGCENLCWPADTTTPDSGNVVEHQTGECVAHFIECVKTKRKSPLSFVNSAIIAEIGWAAQMSARLGKEIALPLDWEAARSFFSEEI